MKWPMRAASLHIWYVSLSSNKVMKSKTSVSLKTDSFPQIIGTISFQNVFRNHFNFFDNSLYVDERTNEGTNERTEFQTTKKEGLI